MREKGLTAKQVQYMKPDPAKRLEVPAGAPVGLYLVIHKGGRKVWAVRYRWHGRPTKLTFKKPYPRLSLAAARAEAEAVLANLRRGIDPVALKAEEKQQEPDSFSAVVSEFMERYGKRRKSWRETERILNREAVPKWGRRDIQEISRPDVLRLLDGIADRGSPIMANRTYAALSKLFNWAVVQRGIIEVSPMAGMGRPQDEQSRDRVLSGDELLKVWRASSGLGFPFGAFLRLLVLTAQRKSEVARMKWEDVDLKRALWTLPAGVVKSGRIHDVPLSPPACELLENLPRFEGPYIFTTTGGTKPINGFSKMKAVLDFKIQRAARKSADWRLHDLRRSAATWMAGAGVPPHVLAAVLNHTPGSTMGITAIYVRHRYSQECRDALEKWGQYVVRLARPARLRAVL